MRGRHTWRPERGALPIAWLGVLATVGAAGTSWWAFADFRVDRATNGLSCSVSRQLLPFVRPASSAEFGLTGSARQACQALLAQESKCPVVPPTEARYCEQHLSPGDSAALARRSGRLGAVPIVLGQPWTFSFIESLDSVLGRGSRPMSRFGSCDLESRQPPRALRLFSAAGWPACLGFMTQDGKVGTAAHCLQAKAGDLVDDGELVLRCGAADAPTVMFKCTPARPRFDWLSRCKSSGGADPPPECAQDIAVCRAPDGVPDACRAAVAGLAVATNHRPEPDLATSRPVALSNSSFGFKLDEVSAWTRWPSHGETGYLLASMKVYPSSKPEQDCGGSNMPVLFGESDSGGPLIAGQTVIGIVPMSNADGGPTRFVPTFVAPALWN